MGDDEQQLFAYNDDMDTAQAITPEGEMDEMVEFFEVYEKLKIPHINVFYRIPPSQEQLQQIKQQVQVQMKEMAAEMEVQLLEQQQEMEQAVQSGEMLPERYELEMEKAQTMMQDQLAVAEQEYMSQLQNETSKIENQVVSEKEFKVLLSDDKFAKNIVGEMIPTYIHGSTEGFFLQELQEESDQRVREGNI